MEWKWMGDDMEWMAGSGRDLRLRLTRADVASVPRQGPADDEILWLAQQIHVDRQLAAMDPATLADELKEYGAWDEDERADHAANLKRVLWIACCDLRDGRS